jgi:tetratricopeptide (TPR) repeat protein
MADIFISYSKQEPEPTRTLAADLEARGTVFAKKGEHDRAIADFNKAIEFDPTMRWPTRIGVSSTTISGKLDLAIADYSKAIGINPNYATVYGNRGISYSGTGDRDRAIADFRHALSLDANLQGAKDGLKRLGGVGIGVRAGRLERHAALMEAHQSLNLCCLDCSYGAYGGRPMRLSLASFRLVQDPHVSVATISDRF